MSEKQDAVAIILANRSYLYRLLQRIFGTDPQLEILEAAASDHTRESLELILQDDEDLFDKHFETLENLKKALAADSEDILDKLKDEYTYLFVGPDKLPAPPWESVYLSKERILFQENTLNVRRAYLEYNFLPSNYPHEADDHLGLELDFMAHLSKLAQDNFENGQTEELKKVLQDQKRFLEEHLLKWIDEFAHDIQSSKSHLFYPSMADLIKHVLKIDKVLLDELLEVI